MNVELKYYHEIVPNATISDQWAFSLDDKFRCENCEHDHVEKHEFLVLEFYCPEPGCPCREVVMQVVEVKDKVATYTGSASIDLDQDRRQVVTWETADKITAAGSAALDAVASRLDQDESFYQSLNDHWSKVRRCVSEQRRQEMLLLRKKRRKLLGKSRQK